MDPQLQLKGRLRGLRIATVVTLVILSIQGWTGDGVNLFALFPSGSVAYSLGGIARALRLVSGTGPMMIYHTAEGFVLVILSLIILALSFAWTKNRGARICAIFGTFWTISAAYGGLSFVFSGFLSNGSSAQMGASFIGAYAFYFLVLYYLK